MNTQGIRAKTHRRFRVCTTDSSHGNPVASNLLNREFAADRPDTKWATDITYIPTDDGFVYLAGVMDLCSRRIVGWSMADTLETTLVCDALAMAVKTRRPAPGLLHHSDRGVQYTSGEYRAELESIGAECSMSRRGNCYDNAAKESFWGKLKTEMVHHERFRTRAHARAAVFDYIEVFYNRQRLHSSLGYLSPEQFEATLT
jgi:transposase InsO family protein